MNLYESEAKEILIQYGVPVPEGRVVADADAAEKAAQELPGHKFAVKAQILAGGRGLAGGVELAATPSAVKKSAAKMLGKRLVTAQTGPEGDLVERVYVETAIDSRKDYFLAVLVDQALSQLCILGSSEGGVEFEEKAKADKSIVSRLPLSAVGSFEDSHADEFLNAIGIPETSFGTLKSIMRALTKIFMRSDASLIEINPLTLTREGDFCAVDAKITIDKNALYRHPEFTSLDSSGVGDEIEMQAQKDEINLVRLDGDIGVVVNGAGLALATQDMLADAGGHAANFMDIRTTATSLQIARGIGILLDDPKVKAILVHIHGGGMTPCDTIAEGLALALSWASRKVPVVVRFKGQNADYAYKLLVDREVPHTPCQGIEEAVLAAIKEASKGGAK